jgi:hypothetical protein
MLVVEESLWLIFTGKPFVDYGITGYRLKHDNSVDSECMGVKTKTKLKMEMWETCEEIRQTSLA